MRICEVTSAGNPWSLLRQRSWVFIATVMLTLFIAGCGEQTTGQRLTGLQPAIDAYAAGQFRQAAEKAEAVAASETGVDRDQANYLAGLAEYKSRHFNQAATYFHMSERSSDTTTAANSRAMLGVIRLHEDRPMEAANYLERSMNDLSASDARQASHWTAFAYEQTGDLASAARARRNGGSSAVTATSSAPPVVAAVSQTVAGTAIPSPSGLFALQVGAFEKRSGAETAASLAAAATSGSDLGPVRVFESDSSGSKPRFVVQVGAFNSRSAAASARKRVGQLQYIVAPASGGRILETVWPRRRVADSQRLN